MKIMPTVIICLLFCTGTALAQNEAKPQKISDCYNIIDMQARVACYDSVAAYLTSQPKRSLQKQRRISEKAAEDNPFIIQAYRPSYILPASYFLRRADYDPKVVFNSNKNGIQIDKQEVKFQISFKLPLKNKVFTDNDGLYLTYTQLSFWQVYNSEASKPFRENNYEPEIMWLIDFDDKAVETRLFNLPLDTFSIAFNHQSNGRSNNFSLGWNRLMFNWVFSDKNWLVSFKPWIRFPGDEISVKNKETDLYMGHFEIAAAYKNQEHTFSTKFRNNLRQNNKGYAELNWSFPISQLKLKGFLQYSYGYGESLLDYRHRINRISLGVLLADWF